MDSPDRINVLVHSLTELADRPRCPRGPARTTISESQQAAEEKRREHAARVSYWVDVQTDGTPRLHLTNRSPDPIADAPMLFYTDQPGHTSASG